MKQQEFEVEEKKIESINRKFPNQIIINNIEKKKRNDEEKKREQKIQKSRWLNGE